MKTSTTISPGLLAVRDLIDRHPDSRKEILAHEIRHREREHLLFKSNRKMLQMHIWGAVKSILVIGFTVFSLAWTVGEIAGLAQWIKHAQQSTIRVPIPFASDLKFDVGSLIPTSTVFAAAAQLPTWNIRDAGMIALAAMALVFVEKCILAFFTWRQTRQMDEAEEDLEEEIETLKTW
jgi:hypothetical protein